MVSAKRRTVRRAVTSGGLMACVIGLLAAVVSADATRNGRTPGAEAGAQVGRAGPSPSAGARHAGAETGQARRAPAARPVRPEALEGFDPLDHRRQGDRLVSDLAGGRTAELTLDPELQAHLESELARYEVPFGAVVALEPDSGRVRAYVSRSTANPEAEDLCRDATPPAASVFKVVTAAALVDAGVSPDERVCYGGGFRRLVAADLADDPQRDKHCETFTTAMGYSINAIFAKLAARHLDPGTLHRYASAFGFGHALPFDAEVDGSPMEVPRDRLEFARTAAGFWHMHMSPLHGAIVAATLANDGRMPRVSMVERVVGPDGEVLHQHEPSVFRNVVPRATARTVARMMTETVQRGTARKWFHDPQGTPFLPDVEVAGKTGTLTGSDPYRAYTWFVGFAPVDDPELAVAALVVNSPQWRIKGPYVAREALRKHLVSR